MMSENFDKLSVTKSGYLFAEFLNIINKADICVSVRKKSALGIKYIPEKLLFKDR